VPVEHDPEVVTDDVSVTEQRSFTWNVR